MNHNIEISHEVPLCYLNHSARFNGYDYALVHHFDEYPEYFEYYKKSVEIGRKVILDNSLYELGTAFDADNYAQWILRLQPSYYILPDVFWDCDSTIDCARNWMANQNNLLKDIWSQPMGVAQGSTIDEIIDSYHALVEMGIRYIGFTFKFAPQMAQSLGVSNAGMDDATWQSLLRLMVCARMDGEIDPGVKHHLLGMQNTYGLASLCGYEWITSIDTSNPIACAIEGKAYGKEGWCGAKPTTTIDSIFGSCKFDPDTYQLMIDNCLWFQNILNKK